MKYSKITLSGKICTGKTTLYWNLQKALQWPTFSTSQYFRDYARTHKLQLESANEQSERLTKGADNRMKEMLKKEGNLIAEGWLAGIMANSFPGILKVLLTSKDSIRIERFAKRERINQLEAKKKLTERQENWFAKIETIYGRSDFFAPRHYDIVIDTTDKSPKEIVDIVLSAIK